MLRGHRGYHAVTTREGDTWHVTHTALHHEYHDLSILSDGIFSEENLFSNIPNSFQSLSLGINTLGNSFISKSKENIFCEANWFCFNSFISSAVVVILFA